MRPLGVWLGGAHHRVLSASRATATGRNRLKRAAAVAPVAAAAAVWAVAFALAATMSEASALPCEAPRSASVLRQCLRAEAARVAARSSGGRRPTARRSKHHIDNEVSKIAAVGVHDEECNPLLVLREKRYGPSLAVDVALDVFSVPAGTHDIHPTM